MSLSQILGKRRHGVGQSLPRGKLHVALRRLQTDGVGRKNGKHAIFERIWHLRDVGLDVLEVACELVLDGTVVTASVVLNEMRRLVAPGQPILLNLPDMLKLQIEPLADCGRYDHLREVSHVLH